MVTNANAICTEEYIDISGTQGTHLAVYRCKIDNSLAPIQTYWRMCFYDKNKTKILYAENGSTNDLTQAIVEIPEGAVYVRVSYLINNYTNYMIIRGNSDMSLINYIAYEEPKGVTIVPSDLNEQLAMLNEAILEIEPEETIYTNFSCENDFTIVGDEIWGSKNEGTYTRIVRHKIVDGVLTKISEIKLSDVIHLNTLDYCPENDCLITGNGANDQETEGNCFWIIPNASNLPNLSGTLALADIAIQYNVDIGYKVQAIWGDGNLGQHNLVYLLSNDNEVRRAIIHKNEDGSFANTFTIVSDVFKITGAAGYQGADYYGGYIYFGFGGTKNVLAKVNTNDFNAEVTEYVYYNADGTTVGGVFQGVVVGKNYLWLYCNGANAATFLIRYTR